MTVDAVPMPALPLRRPNFTDGNDWAAASVDLSRWTPAAPEFTCVANAVSLSMPYIEPYIVNGVRAVLDDLEPSLREQARAYCAQEAAHQGEHRRYNDAVRKAVPSVRFVEWGLAKTYQFLSARSSDFAVAYAAGSETVAFAIARWVDPKLHRFFVAADPAPTKLFLWHLAEEVEHKGVAFDVFKARKGRTRTYILAMLLSFVVLGVSTLLGALLGLIHQRRWWNPLSWLRLAFWMVSFIFSALPLMGISATRGHHPSMLADPSTLPWLLSQYDVATKTFPDLLSNEFDARNALDAA